jgi:hypothetical protein
VEPGITLGIKTQSKGSINGRNLGSEFEDINIKKEVNGVNLAWGIGAGVEYSLSETTALVGGIGFQVGFADITKDGSTEINPNNGESRKENSVGKAHNITIKIAVLF